MRTPSASRSRALRSLGCFCLGLTLVTSVPAVARADEDATLAMARERFKEGVQFFDLKQYDKARAAFLQAYALKRHPAVLLNLAQSELRSGYEADAAKHFSQYLREHREASDAERQAAESGLAAARAEVAELIISADEEGATVIVNGATEGQTPLPGPLYLKPGVHMVTVRKEGREATSAVNLSAGQSVTSTARLRKMGRGGPKPAPETEPGEAEPVSEPHEPSSYSLSLDTGAPPPADSRRREPFFAWAAHSPVAWIGGGIAVLGLGTGVGLWIGSQRKYSDANSIADEIRTAAGPRKIETYSICSRDLAQDTPPIAPDVIVRFERACRLYTESADDGNSLRNGAWVGFGVAAAAVAGTVVYYFVSSPTKTETSTRSKPLRLTSVAPWLGASTQGLALSGEF